MIKFFKLSWVLYIKTLALLSVFVFAAESDHLLLSRIVIAPDYAESISIFNPTDESINLSDYYICDDNKYYQMQTESDLSPSHFISGFTAQFPNIDIESNETLLLVLSEEYSSFYTDTNPDLFLFGEESQSMIETESGSFGLSSGRLDDATESIILFKWDGNSGNNIEDVDYFIWGGIQGAVDKSNEGNYVDDTPADEQFYFEQVPDESYAFARISGFEETSEQSYDGNGIIGEDETKDDETSEDLRQSWEIIPLFETGCTDSNAENYNSDAIIDDGSCEYIEGCTDPVALNYNPHASMDDGTCFYSCQGEIVDYLCVFSVSDIRNNCSYESNETIECSGPYDLSATTAAECPLYGQEVTVRGIVVDYFNVTTFGGPHSLTISDEDGYQIELSIWPESNEYQDGFDITLTDLDKLRYGPYGNYIIQATGNVGVFCDDDETLDIDTDWDVTVEYEDNLIIIEEIGGYFVEDSEINSVTISPEPYVLIPTIGETLDFTFTHPSDSRVTVRIFDISGRFITTIKDIYMETAGTHHHGVDPETGINSSRSAWDGRDHLGQIVSPGVYLMHIESYNYSTSITNSDIAPIVVGVSN